MKKQYFDPASREFAFVVEDDDDDDAPRQRMAWVRDYTGVKQFSTAYKHFILSQFALMNKICCADFDFAASFGFAASGFKILNAWAFALNASSQKTFCC